MRKILIFNVLSATAIGWSFHLVTSASPVTVGVSLVTVGVDSMTIGSGDSLVSLAEPLRPETYLSSLYSRYQVQRDQMPLSRYRALTIGMNTRPALR